MLPKHSLGLVALVAPFLSQAHTNSLDGARRRNAESFAVFLFSQEIKEALCQKRVPLFCGVNALLVGGYDSLSRNDNSCRRAQGNSKGICPEEEKVRLFLASRVGSKEFLLCEFRISLEDIGTPY